MLIELRIGRAAPERWPAPHSRMPLKSAAHPTYADAAVPKRPDRLRFGQKSVSACERLAYARTILSSDVGPSRLINRARDRAPQARGPCGTGATPDAQSCRQRVPTGRGVSITARSARLGLVPAHAGWPAHAR